MPRLAEGGIVTQPTVALIGEAGSEAVVPLKKGMGMGDITVNINNGNFLGDEYEAEMFANKIAEIVRMNTKLA